MEDSCINKDRQVESKRLIYYKQEAFEKCWAHSPLWAATRCIAIHQVSLLSHAACASMSTTTSTTTTTTTTRDRGDRYGRIEWAQLATTAVYYMATLRSWRRSSMQVSPEPPMCVIAPRCCSRVPQCIPRRRDLQWFQSINQLRRD